MTTEGARYVADLMAKDSPRWFHGCPHRVESEGFFRTGREKPILRLTTREGFALRLTADHRVRKVLRKTRWCARGWNGLPASELRSGDEIVLQNHRSLAEMAWHRD
jgi:ribonucleoside-diphosphate reductase alpha chain